MMMFYTCSIVGAGRAAASAGRLRVPTCRAEHTGDVMVSDALIEAANVKSDGITRPSFGIFIR